MLFKLGYEGMIVGVLVGVFTAIFAKYLLERLLPKPKMEEAS
jgi:energy-converting hydrogenase A subunit A